MLGITGLLAIFLTAVFAANHKAIFPTAAIFTWCVLAYLCVDFGFWHKLFNVRPEENAQYRAATEAGMAATLLIFLYTFLRLGAWHGFVRMLLVLWVAAQLVLVAVAFLDPRLAATFARLSSVLIAVGRRGADAVPGDARTGPRALAGADLDAAAGVAVRRRRHLHRQAVGRHRRVRPHGRAGADRRADRLHGHPVCLPLGGAALRRAAGRAAAAIARRRRRRRGRVGMERAARRDQGQPRRGGDAGPQARRAVGQDRRLHQAHAPGRPRALQAAAGVGEGARRRRAAHRVPHAARGQLLPLVRARGGQRSRRRPPQRCAAWASSAR